MQICFLYKEITEITSNHFIFINGSEWKEAVAARREDFVLENPPGTMYTFSKPINSINTYPTLPEINIYDLEIMP